MRQKKKKRLARKQHADYQKLIDKGIKQAIELYRNKQLALCRLILQQGIRAFKNHPGVNLFYGLLGMIEAPQNPNKAIELLNKAIELEPTPYHHNNRALALERVGRIDEAEQDYLAAIELNPTYGPAYSNLSTVYRKQGKADLALDYLDRLLAFDPKAHYAWFNKGNQLAEQGYVRQGLDCQKMAIELDPNCPEYTFNYGCSLLLLGRWQEAWQYYENRHLMFLEFRYKREALNTIAPEWTDQDLTGKRVYLYCTQGMGDKIQFVRLAQMIKEKGATVILETPEPLHDLFSRLPYVDELAPQQIKYAVRPDNCQCVTGFALNRETLPKFDYHIELMSLPHRFNLGPADVPNDPYLTAKEITDPLAQYSDKLRVGIVWAGNPTHSNDHNRSTYLKNFEGLARLPNVQLFGFQKEKAPRHWPDYGKVDLLEGASPELTKSIIDLGDRLGTFSDTAHYLQGIDVLVTVDTSTAHLAGAMGKPVFLALPFIPDWRWEIKGETTPWYPTVRLFRQEKIGDWESVFAQIEKAVASLDKGKPNNS